MKKTMLCGALLSLMYTQAQADLNQTTPSQASLATPTTTTTTTIQPIQLPAKPVEVQAATAINCDYKLSADIKNVDQTLLKSWTEKATVQAFDFTPATVDTQVQQLQPCFTDQGWTGFNAAMQKSGNIEAIKTQNLTVSSLVDGPIELTESKSNEWKVTVPLQVVYQNDKEKVTQTLNISLLVGRKINGDLGIMQMVATPRALVTTPQSGTSTTTSTEVAKPTTATPTTETTSVQKPSSSNESTKTNTTTTTSTTPPVSGNAITSPSTPSTEPTLIDKSKAQNTTGTSNSTNAPTN